MPIPCCAGRRPRRSWEAQRKAVERRSSSKAAVSRLKKYGDALGSCGWMISRCGNGLTASGAGVWSVAKAPVGKMLAKAGLALPATLLIAVAARLACSLSTPKRSSICDTARVAVPYMATTRPTLAWAAFTPRMTRCSLAPSAGPTKGTPSSSDAAPVISPIAPFTGPSMPSILRRPVSPADARYFNPDCN
ncbi:hypothetical protein D3C73_1085440 [compost metagenome]